MTITTNIGDRRPIGVICDDGSVLKDLQCIELYDGRVVYECGDTNAKADDRCFVDADGIIVGAS